MAHEIPEDSTLKLYLKHLFQKWSSMENTWLRSYEKLCFLPLAWTSIKDGCQTKTPSAISWLWQHEIFITRHPEGTKKTTKKWHVHTWEFISPARLHRVCKCVDVLIRGVMNLLRKCHGKLHNRLDISCVKGSILVVLKNRSEGPQKH